MNPYIVHFMKQVVSSLGTIIKLNKANLILYYSKDQKKIKSIGIKSNSYVKTSSMKGKMDIHIKLDLPKDLDIKFDAQDENFNKILEELEFIKCLEEYPMNETIHTEKI